MILLLDNKEQIVEVINDNDVFQSDELLRLSDENYISYMLSAETKYLPKSTTDRVTYVMVGKDTDYQSYFISKFETMNNRTTITGVSSIIEQLRKTIVPSISGTMELAEALLIATNDTDIVVNMDTETVHREVFIDLHYESAWEVIKELSHYYGFEIDFNVKYSSANEQSNPYEKRMLIRDRVGVDQPGEAIVYGYNAKSFNSDKDRTETITALYGFGKPITDTRAYKEWYRDTQERLRELHGRHWQNFMPDLGFDEDNPPRVDISNVFNNDKPLGQLYYGVAQNSAEMRALGTWDRESQTYKHKFGKVEFNDLEEPIDIYLATKNELRKRLMEDVYYRAVVDDLNVNIGDTVRIGSTYDTADDSEYDTARVIELTRDNKLHKNRDIRIGEHITTSRNRQRRLNSDGTPFTSNPSLSSFGPPGARGPLTGVDDLLDGSWLDWSDLDGFGNWEGGFGNNGLNLDTSKTGLNNPDGIDFPDLPDPPKEPNPDDWDKVQPEYPGVLDANLVIVPNIMTETAILSIGMRAVNYNEIKNWNTLTTHHGTLRLPGPSVPISSFSGIGTETKSHFRIDGSIEARTDITYIIGYPNERIIDIAMPAQLERAGINPDDLDLNATIEEIYNGNYALPDPDETDYEFDDVNGLNILAENFVILPYDLNNDQAGSILTRAVNLTHHTDEPHLITRLYNRTDMNRVTSLSSSKGYVTAVNVELHHREYSLLANTNVVVITGNRNMTIGEILDATSNSVHPGIINTRHDAPIDSYFDISLLDLNRTIGDIYDELATTYET